MSRSTWPARLATVLTLAGLVALGWWVFRPRATLDGLRDLVDARRLDEAEAKIRAYLVENPSDQRARLRLAHLALERPDPQYGVVLEQVEAVTKPEPRLAAEWKGVEGTALYGLGRFAAAESRWLEALQLDRAVPEVGWGLLNLYALQGRDDDARRLGLDLFAVEPDPHDRIQILLQLIRHDAHAISAEAVIGQLEPVCKAHPGDIPSVLALGQGYLRDGRDADCLRLLEPILASGSAPAAAWALALDARMASGDAEAVEAELARVPEVVRADGRFDVARGWLASQRRDWAEAARCYRRAWDDRLSDPGLAYRFQNALRLAGRTEDLQRLGPTLQAVTASRDRLRDFYDEIDALPDLGRVDYAERFERLAAYLAQIGRKSEADAWRKVAQGSTGRRRAF